MFIALQQYHLLSFQGVTFFYSVVEQRLGLDQRLGSWGCERCQDMKGAERHGLHNMTIQNVLCMFYWGAG